MPSDWAERERQRLDHRKQHQRETLDAWAERAEQRDSSYRDYLARLYSPETQRVRSVFLRLVLASAAVFFLGVKSVEVPPPAPNVTITTEVARKDPPRTTATGPVEPVTVKLTGTGDGGTWYMVDDEICEGEDALRAAIKELVAEARKEGKTLEVSLKITPDAGITVKARKTAEETCRSAGAAVDETRPEAKK